MSEDSDLQNNEFSEPVQSQTETDSSSSYYYYEYYSQEDSYEQSVHNSLHGILSFHDCLPDILESVQRRIFTEKTVVFVFCMVSLAASLIML